MLRQDALQKRDQKYHTGICLGNKGVFVRLVYNMSSGAGKKTLDILGERPRPTGLQRRLN